MLRPYKLCVFLSFCCVFLLIFFLFFQKIGFDIPCTIVPNIYFYFDLTFHANCLHITKKCLYKFYPLKHHFYIVKTRVYRGIHSSSYFSLQNIDCGYSLGPPLYVLSRKMKNIRVFLSENVQLLEVKFSIDLNTCRLVFVMKRGN